jgi:RNA polymerase sigma-70 factor, ECF subfamily
VNYVTFSGNIVNQKRVKLNNFVFQYGMQQPFYLITMNAVEFHYKLINLQENLMRFAYSLTADRDDAKDLVQETFLKALKNSDKFINETNLKAWTYTILKNTFINNYRSSIRHGTYIDQSKEGSDKQIMAAYGSDDPDSIYASKELEKAIETLHDDYKLPFKMHHEGFKYKEIAETLDLKIGTVKSRIFFTRKKLIERMNA